MNERKKFLIIISCFLVIGFFTTSLVSHFVSIKALRTQILEKELPITSDNVYSEVQNDLLKPVFTSSLMASDTFLRDWVISGENDPKRIIKYLSEIQEKYGTFTSFFVSEKTKKYYHSSGILKSIQEGEKRDEWYFRVKNIKEPYEINVDIDMANNDAVVIFVNYKVYDYDNKFIGVTGVGLQVNSVNDALKAYQLKFNSSIYFTDRSGEIRLANFKLPDPNYNIQNIKEMKLILNDIYSTDSNELSYKKDGKLILLNSRFIPEFNWYLIVERSNEHAEKVIFKTLMLNLTICIFITFIVVSITSFIIKNYQEKIEKTALNDKLTDTYNRQAFDLIGEETIKDFKKNNTMYSFIMFDIDFFKNINDKYTHLAGDEVIKNIAKITRHTITESDLLFRWGGDEFIIILKNSDIKNAINLAEKIRINVMESSLKYKNYELNVTLSMGITELSADETIEDILKKADVLMYKAKNNGRNRCEY